MNDRVITYGILGCGGHAFGHVAAINRTLQSLALLAIYDPKPSHMEKFQEHFGSDITCCCSAEELLSLPLDAIMIATPDETHAKLLQKALAAGKHVFIEKPLAMNDYELQELRAHLAFARIKDLVVTSCHLRRFDPPFMWAKKNIAQLTQKYGRLTRMDFDFHYHRPTEHWKRSRSLMLDHINHEIDLLHFLCGYYSTDITLHYDHYDRYLVTGSREDGIAFSFQGTRREDERVYNEWLTLRFGDTDIIIDAHAGTVSTHHKNENGLFINRCGETDYTSRLFAVMENFALTINGNAQNYLSHEDLILNNAVGILLLNNGFCKI